MPRPNLFSATQSGVTTSYTGADGTFISTSDRLMTKTASSEQTAHGEGSYAAGDFSLDCYTLTSIGDTSLNVKANGKGVGSLFP